MSTTPTPPRGVKVSGVDARCPLEASAHDRLVCVSQNGRYRPFRRARESPR